MAERKPLVLDVDGTFLRTDLLYEAFWAGLGRAPVATLGAVLRHVTRPAALKHALAGIARLRVDLLPTHPGIAALADAARAEGREVILASASDRTQVAELARSHDLSPRIYASRPDHNLKGARKAAALVQDFGARGFDYAGNEAVDRPIWDVADHAIVVGRHPAIRAALAGDGHAVTAIEGGWSWRDMARALRPHQWVKNILLFLPMIAAHAFGLGTFLAILLGIVAFSAAASAIYIVNDLLDLEADRLHPTKRHRPFASGAVPIGAGMLACAGLLALALSLAAILGAGYVATLLVYIGLSLGYSLRLKRMRWVDVFTLAALYTLRVVAGAQAGGVETSIYMLIFIFPVFLTLGCVKRLTELAKAPDDAPLPGRGYGRRDQEDLLNMAGLGTVGALVIFGLYALSDHARALYPTRWILWLAMLPLALWLARMVALGFKGRMNYDPIVHAMRDRFGIGLLLITLSLMFYSAGLWAEWFS